MQLKINIIKIHELNIHEHHLEIIYGADQFKFSTKVFYHDISFSKLREKYSPQLITQIAAYIALFEGMKLSSLFPNYYDISMIAENLTKPTLEFFSRIYQGVFGQHLYENDITNYSGPEIIYPGISLKNSEPIPLLGDNKTVLSGCGGGKDSILAIKMLQTANVPFASMQYSHSFYGKADLQHHLISGVLEYFQPVRNHQISIYDDFLDYPFMQLYFPQNSGITFPETPVSIFESLFLMLYWDYNYLSLAHEKSANVGNLFWDKLGREINHQWGKSLEAEKILNQFIQENILSNFHFFSILQPIYDLRIFKNVAKYPEVLPKIHSCNVKKPWCKKCPKCAYVWLGLMAYSQPETVNAIFQSNLFDDDDLLPTFRQMLGLAEHTPFECIGEINESRLAMKKCWEKGLTGKALDIFTQEILTDNTINWQEIESKYDSVYETEHNIPDWLFTQIQAIL